MATPSCDFGKCIVSPLYDEQVTLDKEIHELLQALSAGTIGPENQAATYAEIEKKQEDIDRLKIEFEVTLPKVCNHCPFRMTAGVQQINTHSSETTVKQADEVKPSSSTEKIASPISEETNAKPASLNQDDQVNVTPLATSVTPHAVATPTSATVSPSVTLTGTEKASILPSPPMPPSPEISNTEPPTSSVTPHAVTTPPSATVSPSVTLTGTEKASILPSPPIPPSPQISQTESTTNQPLTTKQSLAPDSRNIASQPVTLPETLSILNKANPPINSNEISKPIQENTTKATENLASRTASSGLTSVTDDQNKV